MAARESAAVLQALAAVQSGELTRGEAAERFAVAPSSITRALRRRDVPPMSTARKANRPTLPPGWPLVPMKP